jgi:flagellar hook-associated protein 1 FlgK
MSLFSSIRLAANTLRADQIALQVAGQNIANANTPGYIREEVILEPAPTQRMGRLLLGLGVDVTAVVQKIDHFLEERLRGSVSDRVDAETRESSYIQLEGLIGELSDTDLSTSLNNFLSSINEVLNQPESVSVRNLAVLQGKTLSEGINRLAGRVREMHDDMNDRVIDMAEDINRLIEEVQQLNIRIAETEGGDTSASDAVGLRDQRLKALEELAKLMDIRVEEQESGGVVVYRGGDFLVYEGVKRDVSVETESVDGLVRSEIRLSETDSPLDPAAGELRGLIESRDNILGKFLGQLDDFATTLGFEFNKVFSSGQGLNGFDNVTSEFAVDETDVALDEAGLEYTPVNGSFEFIVHNKVTDETHTTDIFVDLNGLGEDTTLEDLRDAINAIDGITASISVSNKLTIESDSPDQQFAFADDSSGILASLGINTFFSGTSAAGLGVNDVVWDDPAKFAASQGGIGADTENAVVMAAFMDRPIESKNGASLEVLYDRLTGETTQDASIARAEADGARVFEETLRGQKMATSGVSLDEEAVRMMAFQRSFQASARYIATLQELFGVLVNL